ncbi:restriction endonuclease subunit S [Campylobacter jejuni]|uniref:restriction endonuclease subunit S n=2 Tax=Campylobacter jejuni TaxID=197 RepID=UPI00069A6C4A|nr:restriction endonuclease subunit S [Campylobacter jejuni]EAI2557248.1 restriction endonuclease subunit S [Campylobacter coli]ATG65705.1 type I restriction endonuclease [Campylobacter jejuni]EAB5339295.1 restriction endonuclease subunit S [Campylobacter jejuni]EAH4528949.1 restriction endonuclease subunit S [Campylobacter jejuni]EAH4536205.1 restriction endonuclease subunit S [Campylobacter jejuni]
MTNLPQGWKWKSLGEICFITDGTHKTPNYIETGIPFLSVKNISKGFFDLSDVKYISLEEHNKLIKRAKPEFGDILICRIGTLGKAIKISLEFEFSIFVSLGLLKPKVKIISDYLVYFLNSCFIEEWINDNKVGGGTHTAKLNLNILEKCPIALPPLKEQERIVGILDESFAKIDESIKILEQNLLNLDELMQSALQKAFNPLKDNAKENYKLPQSWEWKSLEEISENISAGGDKPKNCTESKTAKNQIPVYANGVNNNGLVGYTDKATIIKPSLTISARGTIGFVCIRKEPYFPIVRLISLIPCENILCLHYLYFCLNFFIAKGEGSSIPQLTIPKFKSLQIPLPPLKEQEQIAKHLDFVFEKTKALKELYTKELKDYEELKQSLLNKAFKGKL